MTKRGSSPIAAPSRRRTRAQTAWNVPALDVAAGLADEGDDPLAQLAGGPVRERDREDLPRPDALHPDQVGDPVGEDAGLAAAGAGQDEERTVGGRDGARLLRVEAPDDRPRRAPRSAAASARPPASVSAGGPESSEVVRAARRLRPATRQSGLRRPGGPGRRPVGRLDAGTASSACRGRGPSAGGSGERSGRPGRRGTVTRAILGRASRPSTAPGSPRRRAYGREHRRGRPTRREGPAPRGTGPSECDVGSRT